MLQYNKREERYGCESILASDFSGKSLQIPIPGPAIIDESADAFESIIFSAGRIGWQVEVKLEDLKKVLNFSTATLTVNNGE